MEAALGVEAVDVVPALRDLAVTALELWAEFATRGENRKSFDQAEFPSSSPHFEFLFLLEGPDEEGLGGISVKQFAHWLALSACDG